jgi:TPP-dependent pyruvate/acetoin dehydrogenase alpha subunit
LGEGVVYETLNLASLWNLPVLFVVEANGFAQSTPTALQLAGSFTQRAEAFGIRAMEGDGNDLEAVLRLAGEAVAAVRGDVRPVWLVLHTCRLGPHSKGDDSRSAAELVVARAGDPLPRVRAELLEAAAAVIDARVRARVEAAVQRAKGDPVAAPS